MASIVFFCGLILLMLGLIGEYIGRIYISMNNSPQYVSLPFSQNIEKLPQKQHNPRKDNGKRRQLQPECYVLYTKKITNVEVTHREREIGTSGYTMGKLLGLCQKNQPAKKYN